MVWIHGGDFIVGDAASATDDGSHLASRGVVVIDFNYRLGRLGWFATPDLPREAGPFGSSDYGMMDQIAVLRWVRDNVAAFGGNPSNVTIFGTSAGGISVTMLMASPASRGLFAKAIVQSGFGRVPATPLAAAEAQGAAFARKAGIDNLAALRALPVGELLEPSGPAEAAGNPGPIIDSVLLPENVEQAFRDGHQSDVPLLIGFNTFDASLFQDLLANPDDTVLSRVPRLARPLLRHAYDPTGQRGDRAVAAGAITDEVFAEPARMLTDYQARLGAPVWNYVFAVQPPGSAADPLGAPHGSEVPCVFDTLGPQRIPGRGPVGTDLGAYWSNFALTGDPNSPGLPVWPQARAGRALMFQTSGPVPIIGYHASKLMLLRWIWLGAVVPPVLLLGVAAAAAFGLWRRRRTVRSAS